MVPRPVVPAMGRSAAAVTAFAVPMRPTPFGFFFGFFGFDFLAEFFVFGVFGFAAFVFVFVFNLFDLHRSVFSPVGFACFCFCFVVFLAEEERSCCGRGQGCRVGRRGCGEQQQRGEQQDQQDREFPHGPFIGAWGRAV